MLISIKNLTGNSISIGSANIAAGQSAEISVDDKSLSSTVEQLQLLGSRISYIILPGASKPAITTPLTLYVDVNGDDTHAGIDSKVPFKTIQAAIDAVANVDMKAPITISVGPGTFDSFALTTQGTYSSAVGTSGNILKIVGSVAAYDTGTFGSQSKTNLLVTLTDTSKSWTVNQHMNNFVELIVSGVAFYYPIVSNTATQIVIATANSSFSSLSYRIVTLETTLNASVGVAQIAGAGTARTTIEVCNNGYSDSLTTIELLNVLPYAASARSVNSSATSSSVTFQSCRFTSSSGGNLIAYTGSLTMNRCLVDCNGTAANGITLNTSARRSRTMSLSDCHIKGAASLAGISLAGPNSHSVLGTYISNCVNGIVASDMTRIVASVQIDNCSVGVVLRGGSLVSNSTTGVTVSGTGNVVAIQCDSGSRFRLSSTATITGTTELSVDGATSTIAAMRASSPKVFPVAANPYGSYIYE